jgi:fibronectin-binding autotransporter adhesin
MDMWSGIVAALRRQRLWRRSRRHRQEAYGRTRRGCYIPRCEALEIRRVFAIETWSGEDNNDSNWTSNDNWTGIGGAGAGDDLVFPESAARKTNTNDFDVNTSFRSLTFTGNGYSITGNQIILTNGITNNPGSGAAPVFGPNILLSADQTFTSSSNHVELNGVVNVQSFDLTLSGSGDHRFDGLVAKTSDAGKILKNGSGTASFFANSPNAPHVAVFDGSLIVESGATLSSSIASNLNGGTLLVNGTFGDIDMNGGTLAGRGTVGAIRNFATGGVVAPGIGGTTTGTLRSNGQVDITSNTLTLQIDLNGTNAGSSAANGYDVLTSSGGDIFLDTSNLSISLGFTPTVGQTFTIVQTSGSGNTILGKFAQGTSLIAGGQRFSITYNPTSVVLTVQGRVLTWDGGGANNNWSTAANWNPDSAPVDGDELIFPAGAPADSLATNNNITGLDLHSLSFTGNDYSISGNSFTLSQGITTNTNNSGTRPLISASIALAAAATFTNTGARNLQLDGQLNLGGFPLTIDGTNTHSFLGQIIGAGGITKNGAGTLLFGQTNSYTGLTQINAGIVQVNAAGGLGAGGAGNNTIVASGGTLTLAADSSVGDAITLNGSGAAGQGALTTLGCTSGCSISGAITLTSDSTINIGAGEALTLNGVTSAATFTKIGGGMLVLSGSSPDSGSLMVNDGSVQVNSGASFGGAINISSGRVTGSGSVGGLDANIGSGANNGVISPGIGEEGVGVLTVSGFVQFAPDSTFDVDINGITPGTEHDRLTVSGNGAIQLDGAKLAVRLGFTPAVGQQFTILQTSSNGIFGEFAQGKTIIINGQIFSIIYGARSVILTALGPLTWDGGGADNNWSTAANWNPDFVPVDGLDLFFPAGAPADSLTNTNDISGLDIRSIIVNGGGYNVSGNAITLSNGIISTVPSGGPFRFAPSITLTGAQAFLNNGATNLLPEGQINLNGFALTFGGTFSSNTASHQPGPITGAGGIVKDGPGILFLGTGSDYTGTTQINGGVVAISNANALGATGAANNTIVANGASLVIRGLASTSEAITLNGSGAGGTGALRTDPTGPCPSGCSISGAITLASNSTISTPFSDSLNVSGAIGGAFDLRKIGTGTLTLSGNSVLNGSIDIVAGKLLVTGSLTTVGSVDVLAGAVLGGTGTIIGETNVGGRLAPGTSPGALSTGNLTLQAGSAFDVEITSNASGQFDQVNSTGTVTINTAGNGVAFKPTKSGNVTLHDGDFLTLINNDGTDAVIGTFANLPDGANLGSNFLGTGLTAKISYDGLFGNANDVVLLISAGSLFPWHNSAKPLDVRGGDAVDPDDKVSAGDALAIINFINAFDGPVPEDAVLGLPFGFLDTIPDNFIAPEDALSVINAVNAAPPAEGEAGDAEIHGPVAGGQEPEAQSQLSVGGRQLSDELMALLTADAAELAGRRRRG